MAGPGSLSAKGDNGCPEQRVCLFSKEELEWDHGVLGGLATENMMDALNYAKINSTVTSGAKTEPKDAVGVELIHVKQWQEAVGTPTRVSVSGV